MYFARGGGTTAGTTAGTAAGTGVGIRASSHEGGTVGAIARTRALRGGREARRGTPRAVRAAFLVIAFAVSSCATPSGQSDKGFAAAEAGRVFSAGYESISDRYVEKVAIGDLALEGLHGLSSLDWRISVSRSEDAVELSGYDGRLATFRAPEADDAAGWAALTVQVVEKGASASPELSQATSEEIYQVVFEGVLLGLDEFSRYAGAELARHNRAAREGFGGIGIRYAAEQDGARVSFVMADTPAADSGIEVGDLITHVDGVAVAGLEKREIGRRLRGRAESRVTLTVRRGDATQGARQVALTRALIVPPTVVARREGDFGYLRVTGFNQRTAADLSAALSQLEEEPGITGVILDLRGNPGGLLDQAVAVSDLFLEGGQIISTRGRHPDSNQAFDATGEDLADGLPLAVLVNGQSASAAEIVVAALQDRGRAVVIGTNSFGKGTVQNVIHLPNDGELTLTWSRILAPSGYAFHKIGVTPTICTSDPLVSAPELLADLREGRMKSGADLARWRATAIAGAEAAARLRGNCPPRPEMGGTGGTDIAVARYLLDDPDLYARAVQIGGSEVANR